MSPVQVIYRHTFTAVAPFHRKQRVVMLHLVFEWVHCPHVFFKLSSLSVSSYRLIYGLFGPLPQCMNFLHVLWPLKSCVLFLHYVWAATHYTFRSSRPYGAELHAQKCSFSHSMASGVRSSRSSSQPATSPLQVINVAPQLVSTSCFW